MKTESEKMLSEEILISINAMGGFFDIDEVALKLNLPVNKVEKEIYEGTLIAFEKDGKIKVPSFQIKNFKKLDHLEDLLLNMKDKSLEKKIDFLISPQKTLSNRTPFYVLKKKTSPKDIEKVLDLSK